MLPQHLEKFQPEILVLEMGADSLAIQKEPQSLFPSWLEREPFENVHQK